MAHLRIGSRRSALAQAQTNAVAQRLREQVSGLEVEIVLMTTSGDQRTGRGASSAAPGGLKAMFTKELEDALLAREIDIAVHSLKDMAAELPEGLVIGAYPEREDPRDAWISKTKTPFAALPMGARIGTGAVRRQAQLRHAKRGLRIVELRGNVDTRLQKMHEEGYDGIVLASAGLKRLGRQNEITEVFASDVCLPAIGQGALAIECRDNDPRIAEYLAVLDHAPTRLAALAERAFLRALGGSCQTPIAGLAEIHGDELRLAGAVASLDGTILIRDQEKGPTAEADAIGTRLALRMLSKGADGLLERSA
jgi:hydroxymethylbilane synthase